MRVIAENRTYDFSVPRQAGLDVPNLLQQVVARGTDGRRSISITLKTYLCPRATRRCHCSEASRRTVIKRP
jgi:hypothetical protein